MKLAAGDVDLAVGDLGIYLAAYNAGPETVDAYGGVPPFRETKDFIRRVLYYYKRYAYMD